MPLEIQINDREVRTRMLDESYYRIQHVAKLYPITAAVIALALRKSVSTEILLEWYLAILAVSAINVFSTPLYFRYKQRLPIHFWSALRVFNASLSGVVWGLAQATILFPQEHPTLQVFSLLVVGGSTTVGITTSAGFLPALFSFQLVNALPFIVRLALSGDETSHYMAGLFLVHLALTMASAAYMNRTLARSYRLELTNQTLLNRLTAANQELTGRVNEQDVDLQSARYAKELFETRLARLHSLLESANVGFLIGDPEDRTVLDRNEAAQRLLGSEKDDLFSMRLSQLVGRFHSTQQFLDTLNDGAARLALKGNLEFTFSRSQVGHSDLLLVLVKDVSERLALEERVQRIEKMEVVGQMAGEVAHDFNNLLMGISGYASILQMDSPPRQAEEIQEILGLCERGKQMTSQLLALSTDDYSEPQHLNLNEHIRSVGKVLKRLAGDRIAFEILTCDAPCWAYIDSSKLDRVLFNLVVNARDAIQSDGSIVLALKGEGETCEISVTDDGPGVSCDLATKIFDPFFTTKKLGSGLGLAVSSRLVRTFGGELTVCKGRAGGACFCFRLPKAIPAEPSIEESPSEQLVQPRLGARLLVIEDQPDVAEVMRRALEKSGYQVFLCTSAESALHLFETCETAFDLAISDVVLPRMSGIQLFEHLGASAPPFVFVSGYVDEQAIKLEGARFLRKPFPMRELLNLVNQALAEGEG